MAKAHGDVLTMYADNSDDIRRTASETPGSDAVTGVGFSGVSIGGLQSCDGRFISQVRHFE